MESKKVRTLLRVSSKQQLHEDDIPLQREETKNYIAKHQDWIFLKENWRLWFSQKWNLQQKKRRIILFLRNGSGKM